MSELVLFGRAALRKDKKVGDTEAGEEGGVWARGQNFAANIGGVVAPLATGFLLARTGSYSSGFTLGALLLTAGIFSYWFILGELKPRAHAKNLPS